MTRTREPVSLPIPQHLATLVRTDRRNNLIVLGRQDKDVVLLGGDGPTGDVLGDDFPAHRLRTAKFTQRPNVQPAIGCGRDPRPQKAKSSAANRRKNAERDQQQKGATSWLI
jgi:hypothetical protein